MMTSRDSSAWTMLSFLFAVSLAADDARSEVVAETQTRLLQIAFETASRIPSNPHLKDRSRAQEEVIRVCLELDRIDMAEGWIPHIEGWRKGKALADLAAVHVERGLIDKAASCIDEASAVAAAEEDWRRDRIRARIAGVLARMGRSDKARAASLGLEDVEKEKVELALAKSSPDASPEVLLLEVESLLHSESFDAKRNGLEVGRELYSTCFDDHEARTRVEAVLKPAIEEMPPFLRIAFRMDLAEAALNHGAAAAALVQLNGAWELIQNHHWNPEHRLPLSSRWAQLCRRAGGEEVAHDELNQILELYHEQRHTISDVWRSGALRPVAEAFQEMDAASKAAQVYRLALDEGSLNPNARPRALDLAAVCASMAKVGFAPDEAIWSRIEAIQKGLGAPW